nr:hypothetical protein L204_03872 [Cryptococcus depauperatus CBS 7855]
MSFNGGIRLTLRRRREEAELARAIEMSTQQAQVISRIPPLSLSSRGLPLTLQSSEAIEWQPVDAVSPKAGVSSIPVMHEASSEIMPPPSTATIAIPESIKTAMSSVNKLLDPQTYIQQSTPLDGNSSVSVLVSSTEATNGDDRAAAVTTSFSNTTPPSIPSSSYPRNFQPTTALHLPPIAPSLVGPTINSTSSFSQHPSPSHTNETEVSSNRLLFSPTQLSSAQPSSSLGPSATKVTMTYAEARSTILSSPTEKLVGRLMESINSPSPWVAEAYRKDRVIAISSDNEEEDPKLSIDVSEYSPGQHVLRNIEIPDEQLVPMTSPDPLDVLVKKRRTRQHVTPPRSSNLIANKMNSLGCSPVATSWVNQTKINEDEKGERKRKRREKPLAEKREVKAIVSMNSPELQGNEDDCLAESSVQISTETSNARSSVTLQSIGRSTPITLPDIPIESTVPLQKRSTSSLSRIPNVDNSEDEDYMPCEPKKKVKSKREAKIIEGANPPKAEKVLRKKKGRQAKMEVVIPEKIRTPDCHRVSEVTEASLSNLQPSMEFTPVVAPSKLKPSPRTTPLSTQFNKTFPCSKAKDISKRKNKARANDDIKTPADKEKKDESTKSDSEMRSPRKLLTSTCISSSPQTSLSDINVVTPSSTESTRQPLACAPSNTNFSKSEINRESASLKSDCDSDVRTIAHGSRNGSAPGPGSVRWKTPRNDLSAVLVKYGGTRRSGMSKKLKIVSLHAKIGPPVEALPPVPKKASTKKEETEDEDDEDGGITKAKPGSKEWLMMED